MVFVDRADAGRRLARQLDYLRGEKPVVLGLPRGGVPVAFEVARSLGAPLDVIVVRKLGVPFQPELGMGAIGEDGVRIVNDEVLRVTGVSLDELSTVEQRERAELEGRARRLRGDRARIELQGRTVVVVDDGIATGSTARAACQVARAQGAARIVLAVPVAPWDWAARIGSDADETVGLSTPELFYAIGQFYQDFSQVSDDEVAGYLARASVEQPHVAATGSASQVGDPLARDEKIEVVSGFVRLAGQLTVPEGATGIVVFAHGSGSSRYSPRNRHVAAVLNQAGLGTVLFDLLTEEEGLQRANVFDVGLLAMRLVHVTRWLEDQPEAGGLNIGYFGASTGAAAALWAAAEPEVDVAAVVSRGGRPDLAAPRLGSVSAPTLLIVGSDDQAVLDLNRRAQARLQCENELAVVPGASHLFEEPGTLDAAARLARDWLTRHLAPTAKPMG